MSLETSDVLGWIRENCLAGDSECDLSDEFPLLEEGLLDSLQLMRLVGYLEERIGLTIPLDEVVPENFESARSIMLMAARVADNRKS